MEEMQKKVAQLIAEKEHLNNQNRALQWLCINQFDAELGLILASAQEHNSLDDVLRFMAWAIEHRRLTACYNCPEFSTGLPF